MQALPVEVAQKLSSLYETTCLLLTLELSKGALRFTNLDVDVWKDGHRFISVPFKVDESTRNSTLMSDTVSVEFDNVSQIPVSMLLNGDERGAPATIELAFVDSYAKPVAVVPFFDGFLDQVELKDETATLTIASDLVFFARTTFRKHSALCPWRFRDGNCKYNGFATSCDKTYDTCKKLGNERHFGGFRFLPDLQEKQLPWGRKK